MTNRVFTSLTLLNTIRSTVGAVSLIPDSRTPRREAVYTNIAFMESVHAKSYSFIFSTLLSTEKINESFQWSENNGFLQKKAHIALDYYHGNDVEKRKIVSTMLESFLFYSGFHVPMYWSAHAKLTNTADSIHLIIHDEAVRGYYIGYKFQVAMRESSSSRQEGLCDYAHLLPTDLYDNEMLYAKTLYDTLGLTKDIKEFLHHNANKALVNLGYGALFPPEEIDVNPVILTTFSPAAEENHDFFSDSGSSYTIDTAEETEDEDWEF